jgi:hypothetical protein
VSRAREFELGEPTDCSVDPSDIEARVHAVVSDHERASELAFRAKLGRLRRTIVSIAVIGSVIVLAAAPEAMMRHGSIPLMMLTALFLLFLGAIRALVWKDPVDRERRSEANPRARQSATGSTRPTAPSDQSTGEGQK